MQNKLNLNLGYAHLNWDGIANYIFELGIYASILGIFLSLIICLQLMSPGQELIVNIKI